MKAPSLVCSQHPGWVTDKDPPVEDTMIYFDTCSFWRIQISFWRIQISFGGYRFFGRYQFFCRITIFWRIPIDCDKCGEEVGEQHHSERVRRLYRAELPFQHLPRKSSALIDFKFSPKEGTFCAFYTLHKQAKLCITLFDYIPTERKNFNIASGGAL